MSGLRQGPKDSALSVKVSNDGSAVWVCFRCGAVGGTHGTRRVHPVPTPRGTRADADARSRAWRIWGESVPLAGTPGADYLTARFCVLPPADGDLRFHPALWCPDVEAKLPALVAKVTTVIGNAPIGIHRIWFRPGESKSIKKMRLGGSDDPVCVRLWPDDCVTMALGIAEGIESALAAAHSFKPMWATIDAGLMGKFPTLAGIESLTIFADHDEAGLKAAASCYRRWRGGGINVNVLRPRAYGEDPNDQTRHVAAGQGLKR